MFSHLKTFISGIRRGSYAHEHISVTSWHFEKCGSITTMLSVFRVTGMVVEISFGDLSFVYLLPVKVAECLHLFSVVL